MPDLSPQLIAKIGVDSAGMGRVAAALGNVSDPPGGGGGAGGAAGVPRGGGDGGLAAELKLVPEAGFEPARV